MPSSKLHPQGRVCVLTASAGRLAFSTRLKTSGRASTSVGTGSSAGMLWVAWYCTLALAILLLPNCAAATAAAVAVVDRAGKPAAPASCQIFHSLCWPQRPALMFLKVDMVDSKQFRRSVCHVQLVAGTTRTANARDAAFVLLATVWRKATALSADCSTRRFAVSLGKRGVALEVPDCVDEITSKSPVLYIRAQGSSSARGA